MSSTILIALALSFFATAAPALEFEVQKATALNRAQADTGEYLRWLIDNPAPAVENFDELSDVVIRLEHSPFEYLVNYDNLQRHNINVTYLQLEAE